jgi:UDP-glucose 4-epimerase
MRECDAVFHLAAMVHVEGDMPDAEFRTVNVDGTRAVLNAAEAAHVRAFVFFSTVAVYPESEEVFDELSPVAPCTPYGETKLAAENLVLEKRRLMRVTILRLPVVYGPRDRGNVRRLIEAVAKRRFFIPGSGGTLKTMVFVSTVASAASLVASDPRAAGRIYVVTDATTPTLSEIVYAISNALGLKRPPPRLPLFFLLAAARFADELSALTGLRLPISVDRIRKLASSTRYNGDRIRRELGFTPQVGLDEGMSVAVAGYQTDERERGVRFESTP